MVNQLQQRRSYLKLIVQLTVNSGTQKKLVRKFKKKNIFVEFCKLDTNGKHSSVTQATFSYFVLCLELKKDLKYQAKLHLLSDERKSNSLILQKFLFVNADNFVEDSL